MRNIRKINIKIEKADSILKKYIGLMFKIKKINYAMLFESVSSIHTFFMFQKIDVIMLDRNMNVLYTYNSLIPYRIILPKKSVYYTLELPSGFIKENKINISDKIILKNSTS